MYREKKRKKKKLARSYEFSVDLITRGEAGQCRDTQMW